MSETTQAGGLAEPMRDYTFAVSVFDPAGDAHFSRCSGFGVKVQTIRYREAGAGQIVRTLPGPVENSDVTLEFALTATGANPFWQWLMDARGPNLARVRRTVSIILLDPANVQEVMRWNLRQAFPCELCIKGFDALGQNVAIASLKLSYEEIEFVPGGRGA